MSNTLGSLVVSLGLNAAEFTAGLSKSERQAQQWADKFVGGIEAARVAALGSAAAITAAYAAIDQQLESIAGFQDLADKIGDTAVAVASLKLAADVSGTALDAMAGASVKLTAALAKNDDESQGAAAGLAAIGLEVEAFKRLSPVEQLDAVSRALAGYADGSEKTATAVQLFGKSGAELLPLLKDLADGAERQTRLTEGQIAAADEYSKSTARLRSEIGVLAQSTAADMAPAMREIVELLRETVRYATDSAASFGILDVALGAVKATMQVLGGIGSDVAFVFRTLGDTLGAYAAVTERLLALDLKGAREIGKAYRETSQDRRAALDTYQTRLMGAAPAASAAASSGLPRINTGAFGGSARKAGGSMGAAFSGLSYDEEITRRVGSLLEGSALIKAREYQDTLAQLDNLYFSGAINGDLYASAIEKLANTSATAGKAVEGLTEEQKRLADLLSKTQSAGIDRQRADMELLTRALVDGTITEQQYTEAVAARLNLVAEKTRDAEDGAKRLADAYASTFDSAFQRGMKFGDLLKKLAFDTLNIQFLTPAAQGAGNWLGGMVSKAFSPGGLLSFDGGGYTGSGSRTGGLDGRGGFLAMVHPNERVTDLTRAGAPGATGGLVLQQTVTIDARGADAGVEARIRAAMAQNKAETLAAVAGMANRGGSFARALGRA